jgi:hypothetical protein
MMNEVLKVHDSKLPQRFYKFEFRRDVTIGNASAMSVPSHKED